MTTDWITCKDCADDGQDIMLCDTHRVSRTQNADASATLRHRATWRRQLVEAKRLLEEAKPIANVLLNGMGEDGPIDELMNFDDLHFEVAEHLELSTIDTTPAQIADWLVSEATARDAWEKADNKFDGGEFSRSRR